MRTLTRLLLWGSLAGLAPAVPLTSRDDAADAPPPPAFYNPYQNPRPSVDPFYKPPQGWEAKAPGAVLAVKPHAYKGIPWSPNYYDTMQVLYRTTDSHGRPSFAATTVFIPTSHKACAATSQSNRTTLAEQKALNCSHAVLSYHVPYDTSCFDASLSFGMQGGEPYGEITLALRRGWMVSVPDYEGPRASYGANVLAGYAVLDSFRALLVALGDIGLQTAENSSRLAMWGYSSGGTATEFAAELAAEYAPDLKPVLAGAVLGGSTGNMSASLSLVNMHDVAGLFVQGLIGLTNEYADARAFMDTRIKKEGQYNISEFYVAQTMTGTDSLKHFAYQNIFEYFVDGPADVYAAPMRKPFELEGIAGVHGVPNMPVFYYHSQNDEMCPIDFINPIVQRYCDKGANIWLQRNGLGNHNLEGTNGRQRALNFLGDVLDGGSVSGRPLKGCRIEDVVVDQDLSIPFY